jgi:hypothetical protein
VRDPDDSVKDGGAPAEPPEETVMVYRRGEGESAPAPEAATPPGRPPEYEIAGPLGEGGMAQVYEATDLGLGRKVALKCLRQEFDGMGDVQGRFYDEARILAILDHPGALPVFEAGQLPDGRHFYAMKEVRGTTLHQMLKARARCELCSHHTLHHFVDIFERVCQTVGAAHEARIIHRDLKPENVMVDQHGSVYVLDWGLAKRLPEEGDPRDSGRTQVGVIMGTPAYMSPEQARGDHLESDPGTDVFSLGVLLYEILTGVNPFETGDSRKAMQSVLHHEPDHPRKRNRCVPHALSAICMKALAKDPALRYGDARELAEDIRRFQEFRPVTAVRPRLVDRLGNWARRRPVIAAVLATLLVVGAILAVDAAILAGTEAKIVEGAYERIDGFQAEIDGIDEQMEVMRSRLASGGRSAEERAALEARLAMLQAKREVLEEQTERTAMGIVGFTFFSPEKRARGILKDALHRDIEEAIADEDLTRATATLDLAVEMCGGKNVFGLTPEECATCRMKLDMLEDLQGGARRGAPR